MFEIALKINKGNNSDFAEIIKQIQRFPMLKEYRKHYSVKLTEEDVFKFRDELERIIQLIPELGEKSWFNIPAYGTDEWANWMIDLHLQRKGKARKGRPKKAPKF